MNHLLFVTEVLAYPEVVVIRQPAFDGFQIEDLVDGGAKFGNL